jgi:membrane protein DedA with SNARE-associated domain
MIVALALPAAAGYAGVALLVGAEAAGVPVPGETSLIAAAVLASQGHLSLPLVIALAAASAIVGDNVGYLIGRRGGRWLLTRPGRWQKSRTLLLERGEVFYARHGAKAVFFGRWVPWLRITAAGLAGANRMRRPRFLFWNALGGISWAISIGVAAYFLGRAAAAVLGAVGLVVLAVVVAAGLIVLFGRRLRRPEPGLPDAGQSFQLRE